MMQRFITICILFFGVFYSAEIKACSVLYYVDLRAVGNAVATAVQVPREAEGGRVGGTLYSSFINITDMDFVLVYKLDNTRITRLDLNEVFKERKKKRINLR